MKKIVLLIIIVLSIWATAVMAEPFFICDAQDGVENYILEFPAIPLTMNLIAQPDGSLSYDLAAWTYGGGWFDGTVRAVNSYEVVDETSGAMSSVPVESEPSPFRLKIPMNTKPENYKVQQ